eukprot:jgi/Mesvir1/21717/Mv04130-RA.1
MAIIVGSLVGYWTSSSPFSTVDPQFPHGTQPSAADRVTAIGFVATEKQEDIEPTKAQRPHTVEHHECPSYSGPGYAKDRADITYRSVPTDAGIGAEPPPNYRSALISIVPVSLADVRLTPGNIFWEHQQTNEAYLLSLDPDRLLWPFRELAGLPHPLKAQCYDGWEHPQSELRGHFTGHFLSATAFSYAATGLKPLRDAGRYLVDGIAEAQAALRKANKMGYVSAFPDEFFDRVEAVKPVWAPYYTVHKILQGLLHQGTVGRYRKAIEVARGLADYFYTRVETLIQTRSLEYHWSTLHQECGGMNDVLYELASVTGDPKYAKLASRFDKPCFLGRLALVGESGSWGDGLSPPPWTPWMACTATPTSRSCSHVFVTGGTTQEEIWEHPMEAGSAVMHHGPGTQESCVQHNLLKVASRLLSWGGQPRFADYLERTLYNGILGTQRANQPGQMLYQMPLGPGSSKAGRQMWRKSGWSTPYHDFWCCMGTGIEGFAKLPEHVFWLEASRKPSGSGADAGKSASSSSSSSSFPRGSDTGTPGQTRQGGGPLESSNPPDDAPPILSVMLFIPSQLVWHDGGYLVSLTTAGPETQVPRGRGLDATWVRLALEPLTTAVTVDGDELARARASAGPAKPVRVHVRVPDWATSVVVGINGQTISTPIREAPSPLSSSPSSWSASRREGPGTGASSGPAGSSSAPPRAGMMLEVPPRVWARGDVLQVEFGIGLRSEHVRDGRDEFKSMHAVLFGPLVLAGLAAVSHSVNTLAMPPVGSGDPLSEAGLSEWVIPVPDSARKAAHSLYVSVYQEDLAAWDEHGSSGARAAYQLCKAHATQGGDFPWPCPLSLFHNAAETWAGVPETKSWPMMRANRRGGLDEAVTSTFVVRALGEDGVTLGDAYDKGDGGRVALESFASPGLFLQVRGDPAKLGVSLADATFVGLGTTPQAWLQRPPLKPRGDEADANGMRVSFECAAMPGYFLSLYDADMGRLEMAEFQRPEGAWGDPYNEKHGNVASDWSTELMDKEARKHLRVGPLYVRRDPGDGEVPALRDAFRVLSTFFRGDPHAQYPPVAFVAKPARGLPRLLAPLHEMVDEKYTVYWEMQA